MKKVLLITYYWKPAGGPGVQRWLKFVKYLREFQVEPIVYIPKNPNYPIIDLNIGNDLPSDLKIISQPIIEPYKISEIFSKKKTKTMSSGIISSKKRTLFEKIMLWVRGNLFIPDARFLWIRPSIQFLEKYIAENQIDTIITTAPPHSIHLIGLGLKKKLPAIKWIADFRDPWVNIGYHSDFYLTKWARKKHEFLEKSVLQLADRVIVTSFSTQKEFQQKTQKPIITITNGYDTEIHKKNKKTDFFIISHIGSLLSERNPKLLWKVLSDLVVENQEFAQKFRLVLAGKVSDEIFTDLKENKLDRFTDFKGYLSHNEAIALQKESSLLLLLEIDKPHTQGIIPGKLFEYMASGSPILAMGYKVWDVEKIICETQTGIVVLSSDYQQIKKEILRFFEFHQQGELSSVSSEIEKYHRRNLTQKLAEVINDL